MGVEIERKYTVKELPKDLDKYPFHVIEQGYLNVKPAIRVRREDDTYYMTYKNRDMYAQQDSSPQQEAPIGATEYNLPLDKDSYEHMLTKADGNVIRKKRYLIPLNTDAFTETDAQDLQIDKSALKIELDVFDAPYDGTIIAEVEFPSEEAASAYKPADWFDQDVTGDKRYSNAQMSLRQ
ncbi:CYTH domain-containing protein [Butyrivibrio sp. FCS006]|uniref:CYTH domain-containing protein n=1 Tax=Butyrivibrio sp. FCS006 TaxID=1280684 RepID=UPI0004246551|nr:CYTH domain-containing protein [Butyrivibrio sp. FCS006]